MQDAESLLILKHSLPSSKIRALLARFDSPQKALSTLPDWEQELSWKEDLKQVELSCITLLPFNHTSFPDSLRHIPDPPLLLYVNGALLPQDAQSIAIIGTRNCTPEGEQAASHFAKQLAPYYTIVSGLARGIDTQAHLGALETGRTIAFLGSGLNHIYPKENLALASNISKNGAVISEYPMNAPPQKFHFPKRNRLISGFSLGILLVEAPLKSGAMLTMEMAVSQKKHCFTLPSQSPGNFSFIRTQKAHLVENPEQMISQLQANQLSCESVQLTFFGPRLN